MATIVTGKGGYVTITLPPSGTFSYGIHKWSVKTENATFAATIMGTPAPVGVNRVVGLVDATGSLSFRLDDTNTMASVITNPIITTLVLGIVTGQTVTINGAVVKSWSMDLEVEGEALGVLDWELATTSATPVQSA